MSENLKSPWLTKPAGVFVQLLGAFSLIGGLILIGPGYRITGIIAAILGIILLWCGRVGVRPRNT